jgi:hypothetical protein
VLSIGGKTTGKRTKKKKKETGVRMLCSVLIPYELPGTHHRKPLSSNRLRKRRKETMSPSKYFPSDIET